MSRFFGTDSDKTYLSGFVKDKLFYRFADRHKSTNTLKMNFIHIFLLRFQFKYFFSKTDPGILIHDGNDRELLRDRSCLNRCGNHSAGLCFNHAVCHPDKGKRKRKLSPFMNVKVY